MKTNFSSRYRPFASGLLAIACLTTLVVSEAGASLIVNGSFENPPRPPGGSTVVPTGWTDPFATGAIIHPPIGGAQGPLYPAAEDGLQYELLNGGPLNQIFNVSTPGQYQLTWFDNTLTDRTTEYYVRVFDNLNNVIASSFVGNYHGDSTSWNARSLLVAFGTGSYTLSFQHRLDGLSDGREYFALDNVNLDAVAVPEPTTMIAGLLLLLPFGLTTLRALRQRPHSVGGLFHK
ncbi:MAG: hypothetical protein U1F83_06410 [Verrucomicrobiota bacterium]